MQPDKCNPNHGGAVRDHRSIASAWIAFGLLLAGLVCFAGLIGRQLHTQAAPAHLSSQMRQLRPLFPSNGSTSPGDQFMAGKFGMPVVLPSEFVKSVKYAGDPAASEKRNGPKSLSAHVQPTSSSKVVHLIITNKLHLAAREIFLEARSTNAHVWNIPARQVKAGFLNDALDTIAVMHPNMQPDALLTLVEDDSPIPQEVKTQLTQQALDMVKKSLPEASAYPRAGTLVKIALFFSRNDENEKAQTVFEEALRVAENGLNEIGRGGYRQVTGAMVLEAGSNRHWMIVLVKQRLQSSQQTANTAFAYGDIARAALRLGQSELASELIDAGVLAANADPDASMRKYALESLARLALEADFPKKLDTESPVTQAVRLARMGNYQGSHALVSTLSETLYVDHKLTAYKRVFDDAIKRQDLNAALYFIRHPVRQLPSMQGTTWRQLAELQVKRGKLKDAADSYRQAALVISNGSKRPRHFEEVKASITLAASMRDNNFEKDGRKEIINVPAMLNFIPEKQVRDRIKAGVLLSEELWKFGMHEEARRQILQAYHLVGRLGSNESLETASMLSEIGKTVSAFK